MESSVKCEICDNSFYEKELQEGLCKDCFDNTEEVVVFERFEDGTIVYPS